MDAIRQRRPDHRGSSENNRQILVALGIALATLYALSTTVPSGPATPIAAGLFLVGGLALAWVSRQRSADNTESTKTPFPAKLTNHPELLVAYHSLCHSLSECAAQSDEILRDATIVRLAEIQEEMRTLAAGRIVFTGTEAWRTAYERVLSAPGMHKYLSVAWLRSEDYWRDAPGRHSMQLNYDLIQLGVQIERTLILNDFFWPPGAELPAKVICQWIEEQYKRGIVVRLVRESEIQPESELLCDFGIYGDRSTGQLELDDQCRPLRFTLDFTPQAVRLFEERWQRLLLFAVPFRDLLDRVIQGQ